MDRRKFIGIILLAFSILIPGWLIFFREDRPRLSSFFRSDEEIRKRLKARPAERNCGSDEFIQSQIDYSAWFKKNRGKFQKFIDNTGQTPEETAEIIAEYVKNL